MSRQRSQTPRPLRAQGNLPGQRGVERGHHLGSGCWQGAGQRQIVAGVVGSENRVSGVGFGQEGAQLAEEPRHFGQDEAAALVESSQRTGRR